MFRKRKSQIKREVLDRLTDKDKICPMCGDYLSQISEMHFRCPNCGDLTFNKIVAKPPLIPTKQVYINLGASIGAMLGYYLIDKLKK